jgi:hypothetical protein
MFRKKTLLYGKALNDATYPLVIKENGKTVWRCPFYKTWSSMIVRSFSSNFKEKYPSYKDVSCCEEWKVFSNFKQWMEKQDWQGKQLDKDLLVKGNTMYSPETCLFISKRVNTFLTDGGNTESVLGAVRDKYGMFIARISNPLSKNNREYIGYFKTEEEAHQAWKKRKHEMALALAEEQTDSRVAEALKQYYT